MSNSHYPSMTEEQLNELIHESGMVDGVFHPMAAVSPASVGGTLTKLYPEHRILDDDYPVSWVEVRSGDFLEAVVSWSGDPVETLEIKTEHLSNFSYGDRENSPNRRMNRLADADVSIADALEQVLSWFPTHSEVKHGTVYDYNELDSWEALVERYPQIQERTKWVKENYPEAVTWEDYIALVEEHITKEKIYIFP